MNTALFRTVVVVAGLAASLSATAQPRDTKELVDLSLEDLATMSVTSVFRRAAPLADAPTAIFVISGDDIRRSGAVSLAEALRIAPNLQVARVGSRTYAISARGFNNAIANKLLVLVDGRAIYSPVFSGVFWDQQDVMLEDVERIEVISGPGATQWGANAVNGVINVITRPAASTQGALLAATVGNIDDGAAVRYGGKVGDGAFRIYAKALDRGGMRRADGGAAGDGWRRAQAGFRADWAGSTSKLVLQGDAYDGRADAGTALGTPSFSGANLLARWSRRFDDGSDLRVQAYVNRADRDDVTTFRDKMQLYDVEAQYGATWGANHKVTWGAGYRWAQDRTQPSLIAFIPARRNLRWGNVFAQDSVQLRADLQATIGLKLESNVYTGWEVLPSARLAWKRDERQLVWAALSRAVRAPARLDRELFIPATPPFQVQGGPDFESEVANVAEVGYRANPTSSSAFSVSVFYNVYDRLRSAGSTPLVVQNQVEGDATGVEMWGGYQAAPWWRLTGGLAVLRQDLRAKAGGANPQAGGLGNDPGHQWVLRSSFTLPRGIEADLALRRVGALPAPAVPAYAALDARVAWRASPDLELALVVQNAFDRGHAEFNTAGGIQIARSAFLKLAWRI